MPASNAVETKIQKERGESPRSFCIFVQLIIFFKILIKETEEYTPPEYRVLRLENPMIFVREHKHLCLKPMHLCRIERHHALRCKNTIVKFSYCDKDWSSPVIDKLMGRIGICAARDGILFIPIRTAEIEICEPHFFSLKILVASILKIPACDTRAAKRPS